MLKMPVLKILLIIITVLIISAAVSSIVCSREIKVTEYSVSIQGIHSEAKIVCISDLHSKEYGENNKELTGIIAEQTPDAIFADGDMISRDASEEDVQKFVELIRELLKIAPVYYSTGNHEVDYMEEHGEELLDRIEETGAVVLYDTYVETEIKGNTVRIGGTSGHYRDINWEEQRDYAMQKEIGSTEIPAIVMMHMPENMTEDAARSNWNSDLYISGHTHGGLIRLPFIGGIVAPTQGLFPKYDYGQFLVDERLNLIITSGLSGYGWLPRIFNRPEICVITLTPAQ